MAVSATSLAGHLPHPTAQQASAGRSGHDPGTRLPGRGKTGRRPPAPATGPGSELTRACSRALTWRRPIPQASPALSESSGPGSEAGRAGAAPGTQEPEPAPGPLAITAPNKVTSGSLPNQRRGKKVLPRRCVSRKPHGKEKLQESSKQLFKPSGPDWALRQRSALCGLPIKPSRHQIKQEFS